MQTAAKLTLGTATITSRDGFWLVSFMGEGSFIVGEQMFGHAGAALRFIRLRGLRVV